MAQKDYLGALSSDYTALAKRLDTLFTFLYPANVLNELLVAEDLIYIKLFHFILDISFRCVKFPLAVTYWEAVLFLDHNLGLHGKITSNEDVKQIG